MTEFSKWLEQTGLSNNEAAEELSYSYQAVSELATGKKEPRRIHRLAMAAIAAGLPPWAPENAHVAESIRPVAKAIREAREAA